MIFCDVGGGTLARHRMRATASFVGVEPSFAPQQLALQGARQAVRHLPSMIIDRNDCCVAAAHAKASLCLQAASYSNAGGVRR